MWRTLRTLFLWVPIPGYLALWWLLAGTPGDEQGVPVAAPTAQRLLLAWTLCATTQALLIAAEVGMPRRGRWARDAEWAFYLFAVVAAVDALVLGGARAFVDLATGLNSVSD